MSRLLAEEAKAQRAAHAAAPAIAQAVELVSAYTGLLRPGGRVVVVTPQEAGFRSDPSHVEFLDFEALERLFARLQLSKERSYSFPLPRACGRFFRYNEFVVVGAKP